MLYTQDNTYTLRSLCERNVFSKSHQREKTRYLPQQLLHEPQVLFVALQKLRATQHCEQLNPSIQAETRHTVGVAANYPKPA